MQPLKAKAIVKPNTEKPLFSAILLLFAVLFLALCFSSTFAEGTTNSNTTNTQSNPSAYKWTDQQGIVHFGDQPADPTSQKYDINAPAPATQQTTTTSASTQEKSSTDNSDNSNNPVDDKAASQSALTKQQDEIAENCKKAKDNVALLENNTRRIFVTGADGQPHYLTDDERKAQMDLAQKQITAYCDEESKDSKSTK